MGSEPAGPLLQIFHAHPGNPVAEHRIRAVAEAIEKGEGIRWSAVNIALVDHERLRELNREWLGDDNDTDVLSFLLDEKAAEQGVIEGEVYVDVETARERAPEFGATTEEEVVRYIAHGLLHLCGHDDATEEERQAMRELEDRYLET